MYFFLLLNVLLLLDLELDNQLRVRFYCIVNAKIILRFPFIIDVLIFVC